MTDLLPELKKNLVIQHDADDELLQVYLDAATNYAESYQHVGDNYYSTNEPNFTTKMAIILYSTFLYESRDAGTAGFFSPGQSSAVQSAVQTMNAVNNLLRLDRVWSV
jgi:uncharacterized phage protein (predicted DNA packaging)